MNISGVLVRSRPENIDAVWQGLEQLAGVEVHGANPDGRLVVTVEEQSDQGMADAVVRLQDLPGVIAASMIYHQFEDIDEHDDAESVVAVSSMTTHGRPPKLRPETLNSQESQETQP